MKTEVAGQLFIKSSNVRFHENPPVRSQIVQCIPTDEQADGPNLTGAPQSYKTV
jgi:hypothetical protein